MFRDEKLELKVGLFIGLGIFLMFFIVFSIGDVYFFRKGYDLRAVFDYVNGLAEDAPVRLAGVHVGEVKNVTVYYDEDARKTRVKLRLWIDRGVRIEKDAIARINTLGLLGEQYLEISPGTVPSFLQPGDTVKGRNPVHVGEQMEIVSDIIKRIGKGEGTIGKLLMEEKIYNDLEVFVSDIKAHPWKLLHKPTDARRKRGERKERGGVVRPRR